RRRHEPRALRAVANRGALLFCRPTGEIVLKTFRGGNTMEQATLSPTRHPRGGLYFEDFPLGQTFEHRLTRTVTQMDNMLFSNMTLNPQPLHIDRHFCEQETEWGKPLMNSLF